MTIFYFTSTGNSLAVAKAIGGKLVSIPQVIESPDLRFEDDVIGLVFPIYGFGLPKMVRRFVENVSWTADYAFAAGTYGNMPGPAMHTVQRLAAVHGNRFDYAESLLMVDNCLPIFDISKQVEALPQKKTDENLARIVAEIAARKRLQAKASLPMRMLAAVIGAANQYVMNGSNGSCKERRESLYSLTSSNFMACPQILGAGAQCVSLFARSRYRCRHRELWQSLTTCGRIYKTKIRTQRKCQ